LEKIFEVTGIKPAAENALLWKNFKESDELISKTDVGVSSRRQYHCIRTKVKHYEIATYGTLRLCKTLGESCNLLAISLEQRKEQTLR
jgi:ferritin-like metal-binding protein YciE